MPTTPSSPRILIVDDLASVRTALEDLLQRPGLEIVQAAGEEEALALVNADNMIALVCMDLHLESPTESGYSAIGAIRLKRKKLPIIVISNRERGVDKATTFSQGANGYMPKGELFANDDSGAAKLYALIRQHCPALATFYP